MKLARAYGCPVELSLDVLGGKWKALVLARLKQTPLRYGELRRTIPALSDKMLSQRLRELEEGGLIEQIAIEGVTARAYTLTARGRSLQPVLQALYDWGSDTAREFDVAFRDDGA